MNVPYVKVFDKEGNLSNPIVDGRYINMYRNRRQRRQQKETDRFRNNRKGRNNAGLSVYKDSKYKRVIQAIKDSKGRIIKQIQHYVPVTRGK